MSREPTEESFLKDVNKHEMTVIRYALAWSVCKYDEFTPRQAI